jgi:hypothetical protein
MTAWGQIGKISMFWIEIEKIFKTFSEDVKADNVLTVAELSFVQSQFQSMLKQSATAMDEAIKAANPKTGSKADDAVNTRYELVRDFAHTARRFEKRYGMLKSKRSKLSEDTSEAEKLFATKKEVYETADSDNGVALAD